MTPFIITTVNPSTLPATLPTYSHVAIVHSPAKFVYIAGQVGVDQHGIAPTSYNDQLRLSFRNLQACIDAAGLGPHNIAKITCYIVNYNPQQRLHSRYLLEFLKGHRPAITVVPVSALARPGWLFEIEATAVDGLPVQTGHIIRPLSAKHIKTDVVVVGAGLSGLQTAYDIQQAGFSCIVLEARDRVGGKTWSRRMASGKLAEVGGAWINDSNQKRMIELAKRFNLELVEQNSNGDCLLFDSNGNVLSFPYGNLPDFTQEEQDDIVRIRDIIEETCHRVADKNTQAIPRTELDNLTVMEFLEQHDALPKTISTVTVWTRAMLGAEPTEISNLYFLDYCKAGGGLLIMRSDRKHGGQYLRLASGTQTFSVGLFNTLKSGSVILNTVVTEVTQDTFSSTVTSSDGTQFKCRRVVISIPTTNYKDILFTPPLDNEKLSYSSNTKMGFYAKVILVFREPWWRKSGLCGLSQSFIGPVTLTRDTSIDSRLEYSLTCFITGKPGRIWSELGAAERRSQVLEHIKRLFGQDSSNPVQHPTEVIEQDWLKDRWSQGCPVPFTGPNTIQRFGHVLKQCHGKVHFVGTETADEWRGYMEGAIRSGSRGASEVIQALQKENIGIRATL